MSLPPTAQTVLDRLRRHCTAYAQESADWGYMRSPRRYLWTRAAEGWVPVRDLHNPQMEDAERQRFSRTIRGMIDAGTLEATYDGGGRVLEVRVPLPPKARRGRR